MTRPELHGCPSCGASVRGEWQYCRCGHFLGLAPVLPDVPWRDIGISPLFEEMVIQRLERDAARNRRALGLPPIERPTR